MGRQGPRRSCTAVTTLRRSVPNRRPTSRCCRGSRSARRRWSAPARSSYATSRPAPSSSARRRACCARCATTSSATPAGRLTLASAYPAHVLVRAVLLALLGACAAAAPAAAEPVLVVGSGGAELREDPALPPDAMTVAPPGGERACASAPLAAASAAGPTVRGTLARVERAGAITAAQHDEWLATYRRARATTSRVPSGRRGELRAVVRGVESLARRRLLTSSRMPAAFLQLQRNAEFWPTRSFPSAPQPARKPCTGAAGLGGGRVVFDGDPVVFQWYPGQGLQIQPLANFGKANALWRACQPPPVGPAPAPTPAPTATPAPTTTPARPTGGTSPAQPTPTPNRDAGPGPRTPTLPPRGAARAARPHGRPRLRARRLHGVGVLLRVRRRHAAVDQRPRAGDGDAGAHPRVGAADRPPLRRGRAARARRVRAQAADRRPRALGLRDRAPLPDLLVRDRPARAQRLPAVARRPPRPRGRHRRPPRAPPVPRRRPRRQARDPALRHRGLVALRRGRQRVRPRLPPARARLPDLAVRAHPGERLLRARQALRPLPPRAHPRGLRRRRRRARRRRGEHPLHALQALLRDRARAPRRQARARAQGRDAARPARAHLRAAAGPGRYRVQVQAVDLLNHYTRVERPLVVKPRKRT